MIKYLKIILGFFKFILFKENKFFKLFKYIQF
jgi:hypothetical protein